MNFKWRLFNFFKRYDPPVSAFWRVVDHYIGDELLDYHSVERAEGDTDHVYLDLMVIRDWLDDGCRWRNPPPEMMRLGRSFSRAASSKKRLNQLVIWGKR